MRLQGEHAFEAPRQVVWEAVMDPEVIARVMPGCKALERVGENAYQGAMKIKVGPVQGEFKGAVTLSDLDPPSSYRLKLSGKGAPGFVEGEGTLTLSDAEDGGTKLIYDLEAKVGGRIAAVGQRLLDSSARVIARQSLEGLEAQIKARHDGGETAAAAAAPSEADFAGRFAKGLAAELIPPERRPLAGGVAVVVLLALAYLIFRSCG